uniref:Uncharacterized protein n=1 Tax=Canis lupus familiaris TaxID=9615 RepID=A0A8C0RAV1_CANLF
MVEKSLQFPGRRGRDQVTFWSRGEKGLFLEGGAQRAGAVGGAPAGRPWGGGEAARGPAAGGPSGSDGRGRGRPGPGSGCGGRRLHARGRPPRAPLPSSRPFPRAPPRPPPPRAIPRRPPAARPASRVSAMAGPGPRPAKGYRVVLLGSVAVGKTALATQFACGSFPEQCEPSVEELFSKVIEVNAAPALLEIVDTVGAEHLVTLKDLYIKNSDGFVVLYSVCSEASFEAVRPLRERMGRLRGPKAVPLVLVGTKADLDAERQVLTARGRALAREWRGRGDPGGGGACPRVPRERPGASGAWRWAGLARRRGFKLPGGCARTIPTPGFLPVSGLQSTNH